MTDIPELDNVSAQGLVDTFIDRHISARHEGQPSQPDAPEHESVLGGAFNDAITYGQGWTRANADGTIEHIDQSLIQRYPPTPEGRLLKLEDERNEARQERDKAKADLRYVAKQDAANWAIITELARALDTAAHAGEHHMAMPKDTLRKLREHYIEQTGVVDFRPPF